MRKLLLSAAIGMLISSSALAQGQAQPQGGQPALSANAARYGYAVVDVSHIFKNYPRFTAEIENLKKAMEDADGQLKADRDRVAQMEEQRNALKPGTPEFKRLDEELARQKADFGIKQGTIRRDFLEREAKIYYQSYLEVSNAVKYYAQQNNIGLVLRFNGDSIDPNQREDIMRAIMQPIVFENQVDITLDVLALLNRGGQPAQGGTALRPGQVRQ